MSGDHRPPHRHGRGRAEQRPQRRGRGAAIVASLRQDTLQQGLGRQHHLLGRPWPVRQSRLTGRGTGHHGAHHRAEDYCSKQHRQRQRGTGRTARSNRQHAGQYATHRPATVNRPSREELLARDSKHLAVVGEVPEGGPLSPIDRPDGGPPDMREHQSAGRAEHGELVGDLQVLAMEPEQRRRATTGLSRRACLARRLQYTPAHQHPLQVGG